MVPEGRERKSAGRRSVVLAAMLVAWLLPSTALGFDAADSLRKGAFVLSLQAGGGSLNQALEEHDHGSWFVSFLPRLTYVPIDPIGSGWLRGTLEVGAEGWLQFFREPVETAAEGLKAVARYDFLGFGRLVPYAEVLVGAGYKNFRPWDNPTSFTFVLEAGVGVSYMVTPSIAITGGYRFQHLSNAGLGHRNRGYNYDGGVVGVSIFFP